MSNRFVQKGSTNLNSTLAPGLLIQESLTGAAITGVATDLIGGIGAASYGPVDSPTLCSTIDDFVFKFGLPVNRKYDLGTFVNAACLQGDNVSFYVVRVTDGSEITAFADVMDAQGVPAVGAILAAKYSGSTGDTIQAKLIAGTQAATYTLVVGRPGYASESFKNIGGTGAAFWTNLVNAVNQGIGIQGTSQYVVASLPETIGTVAITTPGTYTAIPATVFTDGDGTGAAGSTLMKAISATPVAAGIGFAPGNTVTLAGGTFSPATILNVATTKVVSVTINSPGSGGTNGTQTVTGTTGTGTKFQASVTVAGGIITAILSVTVAGSYTANPTAIAAEPVTGGALTGATLSVVMGIDTTTIATPGSYSVLPPIPALQGTTSGTGTGATFTMNWGVGGVAMTDGGEDYTIAPSVAFTGGTGSGAVGVPAIGSATAPIPSTYTLAGGTDGYAGITDVTLLGQDVSPRKGMYALRNTNVSLFALVDCSDTSTFSDQDQFAITTGSQTIFTGPASQDPAEAITAITGAAIENTSFVYLVGNYFSYLDVYNAGITRLISQQGVYAGLMANLAPQESPLNKPIFGMLGTQLSLSNRIYSDAEIELLMNYGLDVCASPSPGGSYLSFQTGKCGSTNSAINDVFIQRMANYLGLSLSKSGVLGSYIGRLQTSEARRSARDAMDSFLADLVSTGAIEDKSVELDDADNPEQRVREGFMQADVQVQLFSVIIVFLINLNVGTVSIQSINPTA